MSIWYPSSGMTFRQFLQANTFVREIKGEIKAGGKSIENKISEQTKNIVAK